MAEGLNPLVPLLTVVKTCMPRGKFTGLLASGALGRAAFGNEHIPDYVAGASVFLNEVTGYDGVFFV